MQKKWAMLLVAIATVTLALTISADDQVSVYGDSVETIGAESTVVEYSLSYKESGINYVEVQTNEYVFETDISSISPTWEYEPYGASNNNSIVLGVPFSDRGWALTITQVNGSDSNLIKGLYKITINSASSENQMVDIKLIYDVNVTPDQVHTGDSFTMKPLVLILHLSNGVSQLPDSLTSPYYPFFVNTPIVSSAITMENHQASEFIWFAPILPKGVSLTGDGSFVGVPTEMTSLATYNVYAEDSYGYIKEYQVQIVVNPEIMTGLTYYVCDSALSNVSIEGRQFNVDVAVTQTGDPLYLVVTNHTNAWNLYSVFVLDAEQYIGTDTGSDNYQKQLIEESGGAVSTYDYYKLPTNGTGAYTVVLMSETDVKTFNVYVFPEITAVVAGIGIASSSSSTGES